jgi:hypothetical protein
VAVELDAALDTAIAYRETLSASMNASIEGPTKAVGDISGK